METLTPLTVTIKGEKGAPLNSAEMDKNMQILRNALAQNPIWGLMGVFREEHITISGTTDITSEMAPSTTALNDYLQNPLTITVNSFFEPSVADAIEVRLQPSGQLLTTIRPSQSNTFQLTNLAVLHTAFREAIDTTPIILSFHLLGTEMFRVQAGTYTKVAAQNNNVNKIGTPGEVGFGVGIAPDALVTQFGLTPMAGYDDPTNENYGNYTDASGSVMVYIPKHYYKISYDPAAPYFGTRIDISAEPQEGYALPRCFVNNGAVVDGIFVDKYLGGNENNIMVSKRGLDPVSASNSHNPISNLSGNGQSPQNRLDGFYSAVKTRGDNYSLATVFVYTMLANLADAHYQACYRKGDFSACAWADVQPYQPKGCNNGSLKDANDSSVEYVGSGHSYCGKTASVSDEVLAKITHNGQKCGVTDLNGNMWEVAAGFITDRNGLHLVLKENIDVKSLTPSSAYDPSNYDPINIPLNLGTTGAKKLGNGTNPFFSGETNRESNGYKIDNIGLPKDDNAYSSSGTARFGADYFYRAKPNEMALRVGGSWGSGTSAGIRAKYLNSTRSTSLDSVGGRACLVPNS